MNKNKLGKKITTIGGISFYVKAFTGKQQFIEVVAVAPSSPKALKTTLKPKFTDFFDAYQYLHYYIPVQ